MNRQIKKLFLAIAFVLISQVPSHAFDPCDRTAKYVPVADRYKKGLFFQIKKCGVAPSYLLGAMHADDPKIVDMLGDAFSKLAYASSASFEIKFNPQAMTIVAQGMFLDPASIETLQSIVGVSSYTKFVQLMKKQQPNNPETTFYRMKPWAAAVMLQEPPSINDGVALDLNLQNFAKSRGITIFGLETPESQMQIFEEIPREKQVEFFNDTIENYAQIDKDNKQEHFYWLKVLKQLKPRPGEVLRGLAF